VVSGTGCFRQGFAGKRDKGHTGLANASVLVYDRMAPRVVALGLAGSTDSPTRLHSLLRLTGQLDAVSMAHMQNAANSCAPAPLLYYNSDADGRLGLAARSLVEVPTPVEM